MEESTSLIGMVMGVINNYPAWLNAILSLVGGATAITALTPTKADNQIVNTVLKVLNTLAGNVLKNKNADE
tara:strand:- start:7975 stop:8187 length:213 start_codon:yes stop_codon:yes gene_type:complete